MTEEFEIRKNGAWGRRLYALKGRAARDLEQICEAAGRVVELVTPRRMIGGGRWTPEAASMLDPRHVREAVERARFLRLSKILDHRAAFGGARAKALLQLDARLDSQVDALLELAHSGVEREGALAHLQALAEVVRELRGEEAGHIVRRRAAAA